MASRLARAYLALALRTTRWTVTGDTAASAQLRQQGARTGGSIVAFWHHNLLLLPALWTWARRRNPGLRLRVLISRNRDGRLIRDAVAPWRIEGIEGSTDRPGKEKGGARAYRRALSALREGHLLAITPDGPRGPSGVSQSGAVALARASGCPVVPIGAVCRALHLPSWDRMAVPLPFGRGVIHYGVPLAALNGTPALTAAINEADVAARRRLELSLSDPFERGWALVGTMIAPALIMMLRVRLRRGKEIEGRLRERLGITHAVRPNGTLLWLHAASVGESRSALPLLDALLEEHPALNILMTTSTVTGAAIATTHFERMPLEKSARLRHQFIPYDVPRWTRRFLRRWRPDALLLVESEIWPGLIAACYRRAIPVGVVNGRLSARSARRWLRLPRAAGRIYGRLAFVAARGPEDAAQFRRLGVSDCREYGDLKQSSPPPAAAEEALANLRHAVGARPVLLAASTHPGEDEVIATAAAQLRRRYPDLLCVIAPRHPARADELAHALGDPPRRSRGDLPKARDGLWLADTLGEMGLIYRIATVAWLGNSIAPDGGGHNPYEAIRIGVPLATGPHVGNFHDAFARLGDTVASCGDPAAIAAWAAPLLADPILREERARAAQDVIGTAAGIPAPLLTRIAAILPT